MTTPGSDQVDDPLPPAGTTLHRASWTDLEEVADLYRRCELDRVGTATFRTEDLRYRWLSGGDFDDTLLVRDDGRLVGYAEFHADRDPWTHDLDLYVEGRVDPRHTGRGIATFLLQRAISRARAAAADADVTNPIVLRTTVTDGDERAREFFTRRGFAPVRHFLEMRLELEQSPPPPQWPPGVSCRTPHPDELEAVWAVHQRSFADLATHVPSDFEDWRHDRLDRDPGHDLSLWFLAEVDGDPVGVCLTRAGAPEGSDLGYVRDLGVLPEWRRRGVAMALLRAAFAAFRDRGLTGAGLEVDDVTLDGAVRLYRAAGMRIVRRTDVMERPIRPAGSHRRQIRDRDA